MAVRRRFKSTLATIAVLVPVVAFVVYSSFFVGEYECEVCIDFEGRSNCRTVKAATEAEALRGAIDNTCALLSSGVTDTMRCSRTEPSTASCRPLGDG
jgi:hypothetical protein